MSSTSNVHRSSQARRRAGPSDRASGRPAGPATVSSRIPRAVATCSAISPAPPDQRVQADRPARPARRRPGTGRQCARGLDRQPGLAHPARPGQGDQPIDGQPLAHHVDGVAASDQPPLGLRRRRCRQVGPGHGRWRDRRRQARVPTQDRLVQRVQLRARVQAQLVAQPAAEPLVGGQGLALAPRAVERAQVCRAQTLSPRVRGDEVGQLACDEGVLAERQPRLGEVLQRSQPLLLEPLDSRTHERLVGEVGVRGAAPQRQRLREQGDAPRRLPLCPRSDEQGGEPACVDRVGRCPQQVSRVAVPDQVAATRLAGSQCPAQL